MHARRLLATAVVALVLSVAAVVVPVRMAWSAPELRVAELGVPGVRRLAVPFARLAPPLARAVTAPFAVSHLGVRWTGGEDAVVEVRTADAPGAWDRWRAVEVAHDLGDEGRREVLSGLVRASGDRHVQVRARGDARDLEVVAIDAEHGRRHTATG
jgi:hypothetical protein